MKNIERGAMKQALEALEYIDDGANNQGAHTGISWRCVSNKAQPAITSLRQAISEAEGRNIAEAEKQEPVACDGDFPEGFDGSLGIPAQALRQANAALCEITNNRMWDVPALAERMMLFCTKTHPQPKREWVGLDIDERAACYEKSGGNLSKFADAIEAKLKEKNT